MDVNWWAELAHEYEGFCVFVENNDISGFEISITFQNLFVYKIRIILHKNYSCQREQVFSERKCSIFSQSMCGELFDLKLFEAYYSGE